MRESIFFASIRSFFISLFAVVGVGVGFTVLIIGIALLVTTTEGEVTTYTKQEILPNAKGIRKSLSKEAPVVLQVNISGLIGTEALSMQTIRQQLIESREGDFENNRVKALLLYINTPGGSVDDSDGIYRLIKEYKEKYKVPVYAYVDGMCASGGMYIASAADKIYASDISLIGSVGVLTPSFLNVSQMLDKIGVQSLTLTAGKGKDELNPMRPWKPGEQDSIQEIINYFYQRFLNIVTESRHRLSRTKLVEEYGAHVFQASLAKEYGYIDESGKSLGDTLHALLGQIGIEGDYYQVIELENKNWLSDLYKGEFGLLKGKVTHEFQLTPELHPALVNRFLYLYQPY